MAETLIYDPSQQNGAPNPSTPSLPPTQEQGRLLGGALPLIGGTLGSVVGGLGGGALLGIPSAGVGAVPGALIGGTALGAAGTGAGVFLESGLENLLDLANIRKRRGSTRAAQLPVSPEQQNTLTTELTSSVLSDLLTGGLGEIAKPVGKAFRSGLPKQLIKIALPETAGTAQRFAGKAAKGTGKELSDIVMEGGFKGSPNALIRQADEALKTASKSLDEGLARFPANQVAVDLNYFINKAKNKVLKGVSGKANREAVNNAVEDFMQRPLEGKTMQDMFTLEDLVRIRENLEITPKAAQDISAIKRKFDTQVANEIRSEIAKKFPELGKLITSKQSFKRLGNAAERASARPLITRGDLMWILAGSGIGGGLGLATGGAPSDAIIPALAGAGLVKTPFMPGFSTRAAQVLPKVPQATNLLNRLLLRPTAQGLGQNILEQEFQRAQATPTPVPQQIERRVY